MFYRKVNLAWMVNVFRIVKHRIREKPRMQNNITIIENQSISVLASDFPCMHGLMVSMNTIFPQKMNKDEKRFSEMAQDCTILGLKPDLTTHYNYYHNTSVNY